MELSAVLIPILASRLPFITHLLNHFTSQITLKSGSVDAHKLALTGKVCLMPALQSLVLLRDEMYLPRQFSEGDTCQVKNNGVVSLEHIALAVGVHSRFIPGTDHVVASSQAIAVGQWDNFHKPVAIRVRLIKLEKVWIGTH